MKDKARINVQAINFHRQNNGQYLRKNLFCSHTGMQGRPGNVSAMNGAKGEKGQERRFCLCQFEDAHAQ